MGTTKLRTTTEPWTAIDGPGAVRADWRDPRYQAYLLLRLAFTVAPIVFGLDKFFNVLVDWPMYLAPWINDIVPGSGQRLHAPRRRRSRSSPASPSRSGRATAPWSPPGSAGIIINLLTYSGYYDIALRDFGLMLGALTLARLAFVYDPPLRRRG